jgi:hypothetical protein
MPEQTIKYVVKKKNEKTYWVNEMNGFYPLINNAKRYSPEEKVCDNEELVAVHSDGKLEVVKVG